ncbi:autophagy protein Apg5-domain-containing protein [Geranomyces variabilis]|nr:autophagy protein Apg5-domain-containing protein [Geranomyces variabilis]KAJ3143337.1 autophagy protein 5 [Geranomyces variabilis]
MQGAIDETVAERLWDGQVPLRISMHPADAAALGVHNQSLSFYLSVNRFSYLTLIANDVRRFFAEAEGGNSRLTEVDDGDIWFECKGEPLKWHYPVGLLADIYNAADAANPIAPLPWHVTVRFLNFPADKLLRGHTESMLSMTSDAFMSMVKEADFMRNGNIKKVMGLSMQDQTQLWESFAAHRFRDFWNVNAQLVAGGSEGANGGSSYPRFLPMRVYVAGCAVVQEPVSPVDADSDHEHTLGEILSSILPRYCSQTPGGQVSRRSPNSTGEVTTFPAAVPILHGIEVPPDTPLVWLSRNCSYPDNFLHIVLRF